MALGATKIIDRAQMTASAAHDPANTWQRALVKAPYNQKWRSLEIPASAPVSAGG